MREVQAMSDVVRLRVLTHSAASLWAMGTKIAKGHLTLHNEDRSTDIGKPFGNSKVKTRELRKCYNSEFFAYFSRKVNLKLATSN